MVLALVFASVLPLSAFAADPFKLEMPIRCSPGIDCWVVNYVDVDPSEKAADYNCGQSTYDGHKGTDIAVVDAAVMRQGIEVYASAGGTVLGVRNDMQDIDFNLGGGPDSVKTKECGNGVLLQHADGWSTQYCHMQKGSIRVAKGDIVKTGDMLGLIGMSGLTEFPHIHIQVKHNGEVVDPFIGLERRRECGIGKAPLWTTGALLAMLYQPTAVYNAGFSSTTPNPRIAREGLYVDEVLMEQSPVIALWADIFWVKPGDKLKFLISGPNGETMMSHTTTLKKMHARRFAFAGIRRKDAAWPRGPYTGEIRLIRPGEGDEYSVVRVISVN